MNPVTQTTAHQRMSEKYKFVSTQQIIEHLATRGWEQSHVSVANTIKKSNAGFQPHLIRLRNPSVKIDEGNAPEILVLNSHNGTKALTLSLGLFRFACANGIITGKHFTKFRILHRGFTYERLDEGLKFILEQSDLLAAKVDALRVFKMTQQQKRTLAQEIVQSRFVDIYKGKYPGKVDYDALLTPAREEDQGSDAWTVFNVIQEKLIRGGIKYQICRQVKDKDGKTLETIPLDKTTKEAKSIHNVVALNQMAWDKTLAMIA